MNVNLLEGAKTTGVTQTFVHVANADPVIKTAAAMPNGNDRSPQSRLEFIVAQSLFRIDAELAARENPPHEFFKASVVLGELRDNLSSYHSSLLKKTGYTLLTQLIANEVSSIDDCLRSACIASANGTLQAYQESNSISKPSVEIKYEQPTATF